MKNKHYCPECRTQALSFLKTLQRWWCSTCATEINAIKYSEGAPQIKVQTQTQNDRVLLRIEDRGMGMDAATQKLIFERFYREQSGNIHNIKGHGLGLSYVKKIADLHQAKIDLESKKGKGTTFTLSFPLTTPKTI